MQLASCRVQNAVNDSPGADPRRPPLPADQDDTSPQADRVARERGPAGSSPTDLLTSGASRPTPSHRTSPRHPFDA